MPLLDIQFYWTNTVFVNDISIHIETSIQTCTTLLHWIVSQSLTIIYCSTRLYIFKSELTDCLCLIYVLKTKMFIPTYFDDSLFWPLILVQNLEKQARRAEHKCRTATLENIFSRTCPFIKNLLVAASGHSLRRSPFQLL